MEDPLMIARAVKRVPSASRSFNPEYLRMAVADLLLGYNSDSKSPAPNSDSPTPKNRLLLLHSLSGSREEGEVSLRKVSNIDARTVSKICLMDNTVNRQDSLKSVYSTQLQVKSPVCTLGAKDSPISEELMENSQTMAGSETSSGANDPGVNSGSSNQIGKYVAFRRHLHLHHFS